MSEQYSELPDAATVSTSENETTETSGRRKAYLVIAADQDGQLWMYQASHRSAKSAVDEACAEWKERGVQRMHVLFAGLGRFGDNEVGSLNG